MKSDAVAFGIAGVLFGLIAGWIIGAQQSGLRPASAAPVQQTTAAAPASAGAPATRAAVLDETQVNAFGKQDLDGAAQAWQEVIKIAPDGPEGQAAKRALESLQSAHPATSQGGARKPGA